MQVTPNPTPLSQFSFADTFEADGTWMVFNPAGLPGVDPTQVYTVRISDGAVRLSAPTTTFNKVEYQAGPK